MYFSVYVDVVLLFLRGESGIGSGLENNLFPRELVLWNINLVCFNEIVSLVFNYYSFIVHNWANRIDKYKK